MTDKALPVTFHTYPRAHRRQGWIPHACTWNVGVLDNAALGFAARYDPHVLCVQEVWQPLLAICTSLHGAAFGLLGAPHSTGKGYCCGLATLVRGLPPRGILSFSQFLPAVRNSRTTADTEGCGVSMESAIFTGTFSTAACAHAPTRRTVEAREHMSTVLDHLVTHIVDVPFFLARSAEERAHGCSVSLATAAYPGTKLVMRNPRRRPTSRSSQTHGAPASSHWPKVLFVPDSSSQRLTLHCSRRLGTNAHGHHPHSWVEPHWPASAPCFAQIRMTATTTAARHPTHMLLVRPDAAQQARKETSHGSASSFRWTHPAHPTAGRLSGVRKALQLPQLVSWRHMADAQGMTRPQALREFSFPDESEPPEIPPEPTPAT
ncbi:hypothetical protein TcBrA4_0052900 [Trypanosoma cruzi]|nr:hypothetical protein TcBrA4_0052900 [Trypanosoma cruzi]